MESHLSLNPLQANLQDLTQAATNLQADLATMLHKQVQNLQENLKKLKKAALDVIFSQEQTNLVNLKTVLNGLIE